MADIAEIKRYLDNGIKSPLNAYVTDEECNIYLAWPFNVLPKIGEVVCYPCDNGKSHIGEYYARVYDIHYHAPKNYTPSSITIYATVLSDDDGFWSDLIEDVDKEYWCKECLFTHFRNPYSDRGLIISFSEIEEAIDALSKRVVLPQKGDKIVITESKAPLLKWELNKPYSVISSWKSELKKNEIFIRISRGENRYRVLRSSVHKWQIIS